MGVGGLHLHHARTSQGAAETCQNTLTPDSTYEALSHGPDVMRMMSSLCRVVLCWVKRAAWQKAVDSLLDQKWQVDIELEVSEIFRGLSYPLVNPCERA